MISRRLVFLLPLFHMLSGSASAQDSGTAVRLLFWQIKPGMTRDFEEGYKRHLDWHRRHHDTWAWHGWMITSGERYGYFMDASFQHRWSDFDAPVTPSAEDSADNALNVATYADERSAASYDSISGEATRDLLTSPLLTVYHFTIPPGAANEIESLMSAELRNLGQEALNRWAAKSEFRHALLRPVNGATEYLLLLPAAKQADYVTQAEVVRRLLDSVRRKSKGAPLIVAYRTETARYRPDLSNVPDKS
jgi:predicted component of type VI protein secretion system